MKGKKKMMFESPKENHPPGVEKPHKKGHSKDEKKMAIPKKPKTKKM